MNQLSKEDLEKIESNLNKFQLALENTLYHSMSKAHLDETLTEVEDLRAKIWHAIHDEKED